MPRHMLFYHQNTISSWASVTNRWLMAHSPTYFLLMMVIMITIAYTVNALWVATTSTIWVSKSAGGSVTRAFDISCKPVLFYLEMNGYN
jgi:hypothetical protein